jgi:hypothetical protein
MSKPKNPSSSGSKSSTKGFGKESKTTQQESSVSELESTVQVTALPNLASTDDKTIGFTFESAMLHLQIAALNEVIDEGGIQIENILTQINEINSTLETVQPAVINNSKEIIERINLVIEIKAKVAAILSWMSVIANVAHHLVINLDSQLSDEIISGLETSLPVLAVVFDAALNSMPSEPILGITLAPDQKQVSETKAVISEILSRIDRIKQENEEAKQDWGPVEEKAYERLLEDSAKNVSAQEFLNWLSELEQGHDV